MNPYRDQPVMNPYHDADYIPSRRTHSQVGVKFKNTYADGHECEALIVLPAPAEGESLEDWWDEVVQPETGCGHGIELDGYYEATVVTASPVNAHLIGKAWEAQG